MSFVIFFCVKLQYKYVIIHRCHNVENVYVLTNVSGTPVGTSAAAAAAEEVEVEEEQELEEEQEQEQDQQKQEQEEQLTFIHGTLQRTSQ